MSSSVVYILSLVRDTALTYLYSLRPSFLCWCAVVYIFGYLTETPRHFSPKAAKCVTLKENSIRDARTPQPGEIVFNTMKLKLLYRSSETVQRSGYFQSSVSYIKLQMMCK